MRIYAPTSQRKTYTWDIEEKVLCPVGIGWHTWESNHVYEPFAILLAFVMDKRGKGRKTYD
jgi:hypothetical protein